jgi:hypothetical protein
MSERQSSTWHTSGNETLCDEDKERLRSFVPGGEDKLSRGVCQAKYEIGDEDHGVLTAYLNNHISRLTSDKTNLFVIRKRPGDGWRVKTKEAVKEDLSPYYIKIRDGGLKGERERQMNPFDVWIRNENRREFEIVGFDPTRDLPYDYVDEKGQNILNRFRGFKAKGLEMDEAIDEGLVRPILAHIKEIWCRNRENVCEYVLNWMSWLVKGPRKPGTALVFTGEQGSGKGTIANFLKEEVIGTDLARTLQGTDINHQLLGRFNSDEGVLLTVVDETPELDRSVWGKLKAMVTEAMISQERKGKDAYMIRDYQSFIFTSNEDDCIKPGKGDRRFFICKVSDEKVGD